MQDFVSYAMDYILKNQMHDAYALSSSASLFMTVCATILRNCNTKEDAKECMDLLDVSNRDMLSMLNVELRRIYDEK